MNPEIPGYYFDPEKKKYFKIEKSHLSSSNAAYSSDAVKRRKLQDGARQAARQREQLVRKHIKRHPISRDLVCGGFLARETGFGRVAENGRGRPEDRDLAAEVWSQGVVAKGNVPFAPSFARTRYANMPCFYVSGEDVKTGLGVAYATLDEETLVGSHIPINDNHEVHFSRDAPPISGRALSFRTEMIRCPQMSSIKYHKPSHKILLTSRASDHSCGLYFFSPPLSDTDDLSRPHWLLGETNHYQRLSIRHGLRDEWLVHSSTPAPSSSDLICVVGTNSGLLQVLSNETMSWVAPITPQKPSRGMHLPQEIFSQDFQQGNHNVLLAGGRQPRFWISDLRAPETQWSFVKHQTSIAHVRSVNPNHIMVAGLQNSMALHDMRFFDRRPNGPRPLLTFPNYRNDAHFHIGWDVDPQLGVVAAAHDDGTVKLFSLCSGRQLRSPALGSLHTDTPIKALMFQKMPRERFASLFVGEGPLLRKFSCGAADLEDEV